MDGGSVQGAGGSRGVKVVIIMEHNLKIHKAKLSVLRMAISKIMPSLSGNERRIVWKLLTEIVKDNEKMMKELQNLNFPAWYKAHKQEIIERFIPKKITTEKTIITSAEVVQFFVEHELGVQK